MLCRSAPATTREHVLPKWYLRDRDAEGPPPFAWSTSGEQLTDRSGSPIARVERVRILLPACVPCNAALDRRFEKQSKEVVRRLIAHRGDVCLDERESAAVGQWFAKTLLLHAHPAAKYSDPVVDPHALRWDDDECPQPEFYSWLVDGSEPREGISVWMFRTDEADDDGAPEFRVPLPTVTADGRTIDFVCFQMSFHGVNATLVVHPGWRIEHPLEREGRAVRLFPASGPLDLSTLPIVARRAVSWVRCRVELADGALGSAGLPPLTHSPNFLVVLTEAIPLVRSWGA